MNNFSILLSMLEFSGKLVGNFYDESGKPTHALENLVMRIDEAYIAKNKREEEKKKFPPCNSSWKQGVGKRLWCTDKR